MQGDTALVGPTIRTKEYASQTLGYRVRGALYDVIPEQKDYALYLLASHAPEDAVIIPSSVRTHVTFVIVEPHKDCKEEHKEPEPQWWTDIIARAFPAVAPKDRRVVRLIGENSNFVRVPIIEPLEASWTSVE